MYTLFGNYVHYVHPACTFYVHSYVHPAPTSKPYSSSVDYSQQVLETFDMMAMTIILKPKTRTTQITIFIYLGDVLFLFWITPTMQFVDGGYAVILNDPQFPYLIILQLTKFLLKTSLGMSDNVATTSFVYFTSGLYCFANLNIALQ